MINGIYKSKPRHLHLEPTSDCNARCPQCPRTYLSSIKSNPRLIIAEWTPDELKEILADDFFSDLKKILVNGNYGDLAMHSQPKALLEVIINKGVYCEVRTNGGALSPVFWKWLGEQPNMLVEFGIDGLADTHHLYRRNTRFDVVMRNATAFINAGGNASWAMTVFKHNEHQVEECRAMALSYGFTEFKERPSSRWSEQSLVAVDANFNETHRLEPATILESTVTHLPEHSNELSLESYEQFRDSNTDFMVNELPPADITEPSNITCVVQASTSVYLSAEKKLWPCCWVGYGVQSAIEKNVATSITDKFYKELGYSFDFNNVLLHPMKDILDSGLFLEFEQSWDKNPIDMCRAMCGKKGKWHQHTSNIKVYK
jgi:sulfatase maturation enzyme AslB (radical SAM superfamily)